MAEEPLRHVQSVLLPEFRRDRMGAEALYASGLAGASQCAAVAIDAVGVSGVWFRVGRIRNKPSSLAASVLSTRLT